MKPIKQLLLLITFATTILVGCDSSGDKKSKGDCITCNGTGETNCITCSGTGKSNCMTCSGTGKTNCTWCLGQGQKTCGTCNGSTKENRYDYGYNYSNGGKYEYYFGQHPCKTCNQTGRVKCTNFSCQYGKVDCSTISCNNGKIDCSYCNHTGKQKCTMCNGTGEN